MRSAVVGYGVAIAVSAAALGLNLALSPLVGVNTFPPFLGAVMIATWYGGLGPGVLATLLTLLANDYFIASPGQLLPFQSAAHATRAGLYVASALLITALGARLKAAVEIAQRHAEALRANEARFRERLELVPDGIVIVNREGRIVFTNGQACQLFGYTREELRDQAVEILVPDAQRDVHVRHRTSYHADPRRRPMGAGLDLAGRRKDGTTFPVEISLSPVDAEGDMVVNAAIRDITERRRAEAEIQRLNTDLTHRVAELAAVNRELESFSYSVSHDLRAPLRGIDGFSEALKEDYGDKLDAQGQEYLRRIRAATRRMSDLIDDLLNLSRVTRREMVRETVDLGALAATVVTQLRRADPAREVEVTIAPGLTGQGDPHLLRIVLENLLGNAWKFTGRQPRGRIEVGVTPGEGGPAYFVRDNGVGFDMAYANKLFGAFQRLHGMREFPGTGIGLATVQRIITRHGGHVWAEAAVGQGATFYFTL